MKSTLSRISDIVRSNVNELLDQLEDPEKMVRQMVRDMEAEVDRVTGAVGTAVAGVRRLQKEQASQTDRSQQLQERARQALEAGDDDLARQLLSRRVLVDQTIDGLTTALADGQSTVERLKERLTALREDLADARQRQSALIARIRASHEKRPTVESGTSPADPFADLHSLERRLERNRSEFDRLRQRLEVNDLAQEASVEVRAELGLEDKILGRRFEDLDLRKKVDDEMERLRGPKVAPDKESN